MPSQIELIQKRLDLYISELKRFRKLSRHYESLVKEANAEIKELQEAIVEEEEEKDDA